MKLALFALILVAGTASATDGFLLDNIKYQPAGKNADGNDQFRFTAQCGVAEVSFVGLTHDPDIGYLAPGSGVLAVKSGKKVIKARWDTEAFRLNDNNEFACVKTPKGPRLVISGSCAGTSGCGPDDFTVIDPATLKVLAATKDERYCTKPCAEKALGAKVPKELLQL